MALALSQAPGQDAFEALETLETLVVTGSGFLEPLKDTPVRTEVIEGSTLRDSGARSLAEAVEHSPGVRVETTCQSCNQQSIQMLGLPQQYIGILNDGLPNFSALDGVYGIEQIPAGLIGRIEVVKGGGSVLYGPGAVAGVINLIPREPETSGGEIQTRVVGTRGDSFGEPPGGSMFAIFDHVSDDAALKVSLFGGFDRVQPIDRNGDGITDVSMRDLWTGGLRTVWRPRTDHTLSLDYLVSDENRRGGDITTFDLPANAGLVTEEIFSRRHVATLKWLAEWNERWSSRFAYSFTNTSRESYYGGTAALGSPDPTSPFFDPTWTPDRGYGQTDDDLHFLDAMVDFQPHAEHRFTLGAQFETEKIVDSQPSVNRDIAESFENLGLLAQHRWTPAERWTFEYGTRVDFNSEIDDPVLSPRAALLYSPTADLRVRGAVSTGFRAPEVFDEDLHISNVGGELSTTFNDPDLEEESSVTVSLSPEWRITSEWRLELNAFHTWLDDTLVVEPNDDPSTPDVTEFVRTNGESSRIYGMELNLGYFRDNWRVEFSWVEQRLGFENPQLVLGDPSGADPADNPVFSRSYVRVPESLGLVRFTHEGPWFDTFVTAKATGPMDVPHIVSDPATGDLTGNRLERSPWFFNVDVGIARAFTVPGGELTASLGVKNLLDEFQGDLDRGAFRDADYVYGPAFPRTVYAGLRYEF